MTNADAAELENLRARYELAVAEAARLKRVVDSLERAGDDLATELGAFHNVADCETLQAWNSLRMLPVIADADKTPPGGTPAQGA